MNDDFFWSSYWQGIKFDPSKDEAFHITGEPFTIIDTGSSHIFLPPEVFSPLVLQTMREAGGPEFLI